MALLCRLFTCVAVLCLSLYAYIDQHNAVTQLRLAIPALKKQLLEIQERNEALEYQVSRLESPTRLMDLLDEPRYAHFRFPRNEDLVTLERSDAAE